MEHQAVVKQIDGLVGEPTLLDELICTFKLGIPVIITTLANMMMGIVDTFVVGRYSSEALAGVAAGNAIFWPIAVTGFGLQMGMDPLVAQAFGAGDRHKCDQILGAGLCMTLGLMLLVTPVLYFLSNYYYLTGADPLVVAHAVPFLKTLGLSLPFMLLYNVLQRYWQALGVVLPMTLISLLANVINYFVGINLVSGGWGGQPLGAVGVGFATLASRIFMMLMMGVVTYYYWSRRQRGEANPALRFSPRSLLTFDWPLMRRLLGLGLPASGQVGFEVTAFALTTTVVAGLGALPLAAHHIVMSIANSTFMVPLGLSNASAVRVGMHFGAQKVDAARRAGWLGIALGGCCMGIFGLIMIFFPALLIGFFTKDEAVIALGCKLIFVAAMFQVFDGVQVMGAGVMRGLGYTKVALASNLIGYYMVGLPIGIYICFALHAGLIGLWIGLTCGLVIAAIVNTSSFYSISRRLVHSPLALQAEPLPYG